MWKKNILEDLETENLEYETIEEFLADLKKSLEEERKKVIKIIELKRLE